MNCHGKSAHSYTHAQIRYDTVIEVRFHLAFHFASLGKLITFIYIMNLIFSAFASWFPKYFSEASYIKMLNFYMQHSPLPDFAQNIYFLYLKIL